MSSNSIIVTLHGGNFIGGDASWDREQTDLLRSLGYDVHQLDFTKDLLSSCLQSIRVEIGLLKEMNSHKTLYVLGRSSGGYMAKVLFDEGLFRRAIYLAPVFSPLKRADLVPSLGVKSQHFFQGQRVPDTFKWSAENELLFLAANDENVPRECFTQEQLMASLMIGPKSHTEMVKVISKEFLDLVKTHFNE